MRRLIQAKIAEGLEGYKGKKTPSLRAVSDIIREARIPNPERRWLEVVTWPESFSDDGSLPWEASSAFFDLARELNPIGDRLKRPLLPVMLWFWRVTQAAPDASPQSRMWMAVDLAFWERRPERASETDRRTLEAYLGWALWRDDETYARVHQEFRGTWPPQSGEKSFPYQPKTADTQLTYEDILDPEIIHIKYGAELMGPVHSWLRKMAPRGVYVDDIAARLAMIKKGG